MLLECHCFCRTGHGCHPSSSDSQMVKCSKINNLNDIKLTLKMAVLMIFGESFWLTHTCVKYTVHSLCGFGDQYFVVEECRFALPSHGCNGNGTCGLVGFAVERAVVLHGESSFIKNIFLTIKCPLSSIYINADERMPHAYRWHCGSKVIDRLQLGFHNIVLTTFKVRGRGVLARMRKPF